MKKPPSLRAVLTDALDGRHHLRADPGRLHMAVTDGAIVATGRPGAGFSYRYTLEIILLDFAGAPEEITVPVMLWVERYQHDLVSGPAASAQGVQITVTYLDSTKVDVLVELKLTEAVRFTPRRGGGHDVDYLDEPLPMALTDGPPLHAVYLDGEIIARCQAHPTAGL